MPTEIALWRVDDGRAQPLHSAAMPSENTLEDMIESDPDILGETLLLIGRQVVTTHGGRIDLLAVDAEGIVRVLELKKARTPRDVLAQALDYGSWVQTLSHTAILDLYADYRSDPDVSFEAAFEERFGMPAPEALNVGHRLTVVAAELDPATERILEYLNSFGVPANAVFFRYYADGDSRYLARSWLLDESRTAPATPGKAAPREPWNGRDWYVSFGDGDVRSWEDARAHGFVSAGGGDWFTRTLRGLPIGARVFAYIPGEGYVGVGEVTGLATPFAEARVFGEEGDRLLSASELAGTYRHSGDDSDPSLAEYVVPVRWIRTRDRSKGIKRTGMFANQNSACKLRNTATLDVLNREFDLESTD
ncbi:endonuclease NucS domain-containing protein [Streptomyces sp. NPDC059382]|uniref:endonuclease NucS domain-containing protein n=2 Tax=unclassified Streptomyces TaxID=2593676 RepID=UPI0036C34783